MTVVSWWVILAVFGGAFALLLTPIAWLLKRSAVLLGFKSAANVSAYEIALETLRVVVIAPIALFFPALLILGLLHILGIVDANRLLCDFHIVC